MNNHNNNLNETTLLYIPDTFYYTTTFSLFPNNLNGNNNGNNGNNNYNLANFLFNLNGENNELETTFDIIDSANLYIPPFNLIQRLFDDYLENKSKLNDEEYEYSTEKIEQIIKECPVCFNESETTIKLKKCNHTFCENCIYNWLKNHNNTCPICRINVIFDNNVDNNKDTKINNC